MCVAVLSGKFSEVPLLGKMRLGHALISCLDQAFYINNVSMHTMFHAENWPADSFYLSLGTGIMRDSVGFDQNEYTERFCWFWPADPFIFPMEFVYWKILLVLSHRVLHLSLGTHIVRDSVGLTHRVLHLLLGTCIMRDSVGFYLQSPSFIPWD